MAVCNGITRSGTRILADYPGSGDGVGVSFGLPYDLEDVYDTDQANGWGLIDKYGSGNRAVYVCRFTLMIYSDTYFLIQHENVYWDYVSYDDNHQINVVNGGNLAVMESSLFAGNVSNMRIYVYGYMKAHNSSFHEWYTFYTQATSELDFRGCNFVGISYLNDKGGGESTWEGCLVQQSSYGISGYDPSAYSDIIVVGCTRAFLLQNASGEARGIKLVDMSSSLFVRSAGTYEFDFIDSQIDLSTGITVSDLWTGTYQVNNKTTLKVNIQNGDGGSAKLYDKDSNEITSQTLSGEWSSEVVFEDFYTDIEAGNGSTDTYTDKTPFKLVVTKDGYDDLEIPGITVTAGDITEIFGEMKKKTFYERDIAVAVAEDSVSLQVEEDSVSLQVEEEEVQIEIKEV